MAVHGTHNAVHDERNDHILIYVNGEFFPRNEAKISVFDSGYLVGDGIWEALRLHDDVLVFLDEHLNRLWQAAATVGMKLNMTREELTNKLWETLRVNDMHDNAHVRFMLTRGTKKTPSQDPRLLLSGPNLVIIPEYKLASPETRQRGITLFTSTIRRGSPDYLDPRLNCHSKLHEVIALVQAIEAGADEALMLDVHGFVSTCNATNFFMVKDGEVWTSTGQYCMNGITRSKVIKVSKENDVPCYQKNFSLFDVYGADEAFVTGTFGGLTPVVKVDGRVIGDGKPGTLTEKLTDLYQQEVRKAILAAKNVE
jgi:branched-chain amino acid aminotransferase